MIKDIFNTFIEQNFQCNHIWEVKEIIECNKENYKYKIKCKRCGKEKLTKKSIFD